MRTARHPIYGFVPPHVIDLMARSDDPTIREEALETMSVADSLLSFTLEGHHPAIAWRPSDCGAISM